jgi:hypothetical protein
MSVRRRMACMHVCVINPQLNGCVSSIMKQQPQMDIETKLSVTSHFQHILRQATRANIHTHTSEQFSSNSIIDVTSFTLIFIHLPMCAVFCACCAVLCCALAARRGIESEREQGRAERRYKKIILRHND